MTLFDEAKQIRNVVLQLPDGAGRRFGPELRGQILDWIGRAEASGIAFADACRAVGVASQRVTKWRNRGHASSRSTCARRGESLAMVPVRLREAAPTEVNVTFGTPNGYTISGLTLDQAISLVRVFS
jgi:hypothetical protein